MRRPREEESRGSSCLRRRLPARSTARGLCLGLAIALALGAARGAPEEPAPPAMFRRVLVVGASLTVGFRLEVEVGARTGLADLLAASLPAGAGAPEQEASLSFFLDPVAVGDLCLTHASAREPSLLFALDFLFWFAYGEVASEAQRLERLELGLEMLERFDCPIVVGDLPDLRPALEGRGPWGAPMLFPGQVPAPETLDELNERLAAWARERQHVVLVPLRSFIERLRQGETIELRGNSWGAGALAELMQPDHMHPTLAGGAALCVLALDALARARPELPAERVEWRADAIARRAHAAKAAEREANRARRERRRAEEEGTAPAGERGGGAPGEIESPREPE